MEVVPSSFSFSSLSPPPSLSPPQPLPVPSSLSPDDACKHRSCMARMRPILDTTFCLARPKTDVSISRLPETSRVKIGEGGGGGQGRGGVKGGKKGRGGRERMISVAAVTNPVCARGAPLIPTILYSIALTRNYWVLPTRRKKDTGRV